MCAEADIMQPRLRRTAGVREGPPLNTIQLVTNTFKTPKSVSLSRALIVHFVDFRDAKFHFRRDPGKMGTTRSLVPVHGAVDSRSVTRVINIDTGD